MKNKETINPADITTDDGFRTLILVSLQTYPDATHLALFQNIEFNSSEFGASQVIIVGPSNTWKTPEECADKWLNDLPSQRQYCTRIITVEKFRGAE